jgi:uncharacterized damage-inducible protein DinB
MSIADAFLAEFEQEAGITRKFLERVPEGQLTWRPHPKSMTAGQLALHIAGTPGQVVTMLQADEMPPPDFDAGNPQPESVAEILGALDESIATVRGLLPEMDDTRMAQAWRVVADGSEIMSMPRAAAIRMIMLSHWIQHRGQFSVYLRLLGEKVPSSYGPSADELPDFLQNAKSP